MGYSLLDRNEAGEATPRGEIWIGGPCVSRGYYAMPDKTAADFVEEDGIRWFKTGDVGRRNVDGTIAIVDRKKDLIKLAGGEYVALGHVEATLKAVDVVENVCVFGEGLQQTPVCVVVPNRPKRQPSPAPE